MEAKTISRPTKGLTRKMLAFAGEILKGNTPIDSHINAGYTCKSRAISSSNASRLLAHPKIQAYLQEKYLILTTNDEESLTIQVHEITATARKVVESGLQVYNVTDNDGNTVLDVDGKPLTRLVNGKEALTGNDQLMRIAGIGNNTNGEAIQVNFQINLKGNNDIDPLPPRDTGGGSRIEVPSTQKTTQKKVHI